MYEPKEIYNISFMVVNLLVGFWSGKNGEEQEEIWKKKEKKLSKRELGEAA